jgi:hypothetical protein
MRQLQEGNSSPMPVSIRKVAREAKVSQLFVKKIQTELAVDGALTDPDFLSKDNVRKLCCFLKVEHELFLLALRAKNPARPNQDYSHRFDHAGKNIQLIQRQYTN